MPQSCICIVTMKPIRSPFRDLTIYTLTLSLLGGVVAPASTWAETPASQPVVAHGARLKDDDKTKQVATPKIPNVTRRYEWQTPPSKPGKKIQPPVAAAPAEKKSWWKRLMFWSDQNESSDKQQAAAQTATSSTTPAAPSTAAPSATTAQSASPVTTSTQGSSPNLPQTVAGSAIGPKKEVPFALGPQDGVIAAPIDVFEFRDPDTGEKIRFQYQPTSRAELLKFKPSKSRQILIPPEKGQTLRQSAAQLGKDFPPEWVAFTLAAGVSGAFHADAPNFVSSFSSESFSWSGTISFAGFLAGSRAATAMAQFFDLAYDPRRTPITWELETPFRGGKLQMTEVFDAPQANANAGKGIKPYSERPRWNPRPVADHVDLSVSATKPDYLNTRYVGRQRFTGPTRTQRMFSPLMGPLSLAGGMMVSNVITELFADKDLMMCAKASMAENALIKKANAALEFSLSERQLRKKQLLEDAKQAPEYEQAMKLAASQTDEACDNAYEKWVETNKFASYTPDILAMGSASLIEAYLVKRGLFKVGKAVTKQTFKALSKKAGIQLANDASKKLTIAVVEEGAERYIPWVMRGLRIGQYSLGATPVGRIVVMAGNIVLFMEIVHPITPLIKKPWERMTKGEDLAGRINTVMSEIDRAEKNGWVWQPRPDSDFCTGFETDPLGNPMPNMNCNVPNEQKEPSLLLKKMAKSQKAWREWILQDAYLASQAWRDYVARFATMYGNATTFYEQIFKHLNYQKYDPRAQKADEMSGLFKEDLSNGLYVLEDKQDMEGAREAAAQAAKWLEGYVAKLQTAKLKIRETELTALPYILNGLKALDPKVPLKDINPVIVSLTNSGNNTLPFMREQFEKRQREHMLRGALNLLHKILQDDFIYTDKGIPLDSKLYEKLAEWNPFMKLRLLLGNPEPLKEGLYYVRKFNDDSDTIVQETKDDHPATIGNARTPRMTDYLVASMVCGPDVDPQFTENEKLNIYKRGKLSFLDRMVWDLLGLEPKVTGDDVMIEVGKYKTEAATSESWFHLFNKNSVVTVWKGFWATFRPPRVVTGVPRSICDRKPKDIPGDDLWFDPYQAKWTIDGETYDGILDVVRKKARPDLVGSGLPPRGDPNWEPPLSKWWTENVDKHVKPMVTKFRDDYRTLLADKYVPALNRNGKDDVVKYQNRTLKTGALESLYDEAYLYILILGKTTQVTKTKETRAEFVEQSKNVLRDFRILGALVGDLKQVEERGEDAKARFDEKRKALETSLEDFKKFIETQEANVKPTAHVKNLDEQALTSLQGLMGEMDSYWGTIRGIQISPKM